MPEQENHRNLLSPSETEEIRISLCSDRQNQFHKSNLNRGLQTVRFWPPTKFADLALHPRLIALFEDANKLLEKVKIEFQFNKKIL